MNSCEAHDNGFQHFDADLGGIEKKFHLGIKREGPRDPNFAEGDLDPKMRLTVHSGPYIALHISFVHTRSKKKEVLHYRLDRSQWEESVAPTRKDWKRMRERVQSHLGTDLQTIDGGGRPEALDWLYV